jgi:FkbM family methyltransferase
MLSKVEVIEKAVSHGEGKLEFIIGYDNNRGLSRIMDGTKTAKEEVIEVVSTTIDVSSSYKDSLIVCKIDVEGGERRRGGASARGGEGGDEQKGLMHV